MPPRSFKTITISEDADKLLKEAREAVLFYGTDALPPHLKKLLDGNAVSDFVMLGPRILLEALKGRKKR